MTANTTTVTVHREQLPCSTRPDGAQAAANEAAAREELAECRALLRAPGDLYQSPRMARRYREALTWVGLYDTKNAETAA